jgi:hypothetical protein
LKCLDCPIVLPDEWKLGRYANSFRVQEADTAESCVLEFLLYSARENQASVVARVKVPRSFLPTIRDRMDEILLGVVHPETGGSQSS